MPATFAAEKNENSTHLQRQASGKYNNKTLCVLLESEDKLQSFKQ